MSERMARIALIQLETSDIVMKADQAKRRGDLDELIALRQRMEVLFASAAEIRRDQLIEQISSPKPKRRWWHRWRETSS